VPCRRICSRWALYHLGTISVVMETRQKLHLEYLFSCSPKLLYPYLSSPMGLTEWLCDNVTVNQGINYAFYWDDEVKEGKMTEVKTTNTVRYTWNDREGEYLELSLRLNELTNDVSMTVIDFADADEAEEYRMLWANSIAALKSIIGA
jgi:uncharacterized protein YndB with AHSA1/START domain